MPGLQTLDELGIRRVTDKSSLSHNYLQHYERLFAPFRDFPITLLEIGIFEGGSLHLWEDYFPRARIIGVDIRPACKQYEGGRRIVEIASQADASAMAALGQKYQPHIIIDDGSHQAPHILISFEALYPSLTEGGIYIVEDLNLHAGVTAARFRGAAAILPQQYFLTLANGITCPAEKVDFDRKLLGLTESVEFCSNLAIIKKKNLPSSDRVDVRRVVVQDSDAPMNWHWFSGYLLRNSGTKEEAVECAQRAIQKDPNNWLHHLQLSHAWRHAGSLENAFAAAQESLRREPNHSFIQDTVRQLAAEIEDQAAKHLRLKLEETGPAP